jgi:hypothetical protein
MARGWKCARCSTQNGEGTLNCGKCGLIRGGVVVPSSYKPVLPMAPAPLSPPAARGVGAPLNVTPGTGQPTTGWVLPHAVAQAAPKPLWRRTPIRLAIIAAILLAGAVSALVTNASRSSTGDITRSGDVSSYDLRIGDCWDKKEATAESIDKVTARPCTEAHQYEVFFIGTLGVGTYPTMDAFEAYVEHTCGQAFQTYIGKAHADSTLAIFWLYPKRESWDDGDRTVQCSAYDPANKRLAASVEGSGQ